VLLVLVPAISYSSNVCCWYYGGRIAVYVLFQLAPSISYSQNVYRWCCCATSVWV